MIPNFPLTLEKICVVLHMYVLVCAWIGIGMSSVIYLFPFAFHKNGDFSVSLYNENIPYKCKS